MLYWWRGNAAGRKQTDKKQHPVKKSGNQLNQPQSYDLCRSQSILWLWKMVIILRIVFYTSRQNSIINADKNYNCGKYIPHKYDDKNNSDDWIKVERRKGIPDMKGLHLFLIKMQAPLCKQHKICIIILVWIQTRNKCWTGWKSNKSTYGNN